MTQENKELLLVDLCERLPYGVIVHFKGEYKKYHKVEEIDVRDEVVRCFEGMHLYEEGVINCFPYLRPMSSMTEEERKELTEINCQGNLAEHKYAVFYRSQDWLNAHHFDYRGLIEKGLAFEAPIEMYK